VTVGKEVMKEKVGQRPAEELFGLECTAQPSGRWIDEHQQAVLADEDAVRRPFHQTSIGFAGHRYSETTRMVSLRMDHAGDVVTGKILPTYNASVAATAVPSMSDTAKDRFSRLLFYVLVLLTGYLTFQVLSPFLAPLAWAAVFAMMFYRVHLELAVRIGPNRSALVTTLMAAVLIVAPAVLLVSVLAREVPQVIDYVQQVSLSAPDQIERIWEMVRRRVPLPLPEDPTALLREGIQRVLAFLAPAAGGVVADLLATLGSLFVMLFALFFLLRDGHTLGRQIRDLLPLPERERERLMSDTRDLVIASVGAGLLVAAVQGTIAGIAFWLLGFDAPVLWGVATAFGSLVPVVGSALVWVPAALWLLLSGDVTRGVILMIVGVLGVGLADNVLRPLLLSGRTSASGLVVFLGLLGGASAFGFIGLVLGPIVLVTAGSLLNAFTRPEPPILASDPSPRVTESQS
jgi:predicted PurR-regulated permease PerM